VRGYFGEPWTVEDRGHEVVLIGTPTQIDLLDIEKMSFHRGVFKDDNIPERVRLAINLLDGVSQKLLESGDVKKIVAAIKRIHNIK
jgi:hypothetical protein